MNEVLHDKPIKTFQKDRLNPDVPPCISSYKKSLDFFIWVNLFLVTFFMFLGCATKEIFITSDNNKINMAHFSVELPTNQGWMLAKVNENNESLTLTKKADSSFYQMIILRNFVTNRAWRASAKYVADDYRLGEEMDMISKGVVTGKYKLMDLIKNEEMVGERKFYTMEYIMVRDGYWHKAYLYLYFPKEKEVDDFIVSHYSESILDNKLRPPSFKQDFINTLKTLRMK